MQLKKTFYGCYFLCLLQARVFFPYRLFQLSLMSGAYPSVEHLKLASLGYFASCYSYAKCGHFVF
jgi:hypothetical protein